MGIKQSFQVKLTGKLRARLGLSSLPSQVPTGTSVPRRVRCPHPLRLGRGIRAAGGAIAVLTLPGPLDGFAVLRTSGARPI
jgi:hypothetical protein